MKKALHIFIMLILNLLGFGPAGYAQENDKTMIANFRVDGEYALICFNNANIDPQYKKLLTGNAKVTRLSDRELLVKPLINTSKQIRIATDKGHLDFWLSPNYNEPVSTECCKIKNLIKEDETVTLFIYNHSTNKLIAELKYKLNPIYEFKPKLIFTGTNGEKCIYDNTTTLSEMSIDWNKPIRVIATYNDKTYFPLRFVEYSIKAVGDSVIMKQNNVIGDQVSDEFVETLKGLNPGKTLYISNITIKPDDKLRIIPTLEINK